MPEAIINKVAESGLITLKPETWIPRTQMSTMDLKDFFLWISS